MTADAASIVLHTGGHSPIELASSEPEKQLGDAEELVLRSSGWPTADAAQREGSMCRDRFLLALASYRIGTVPSGLAPRGFISTFFQGQLETAMEVPVLAEINDLLVFPSHPRPRVVKFGGVTLILTVGASSLCETFARLCRSPVKLSDRERLALDLFNTSFLESSPATRLLTLVMAVEALIEPRLRSSDAVALVDSFLGVVARSELADAVKVSLSGSLRWLCWESISQSTRSLVEGRLEGREYDNLPAAKFFATCYDARSRLVHGNKPPDHAKVGRLAATLEVMVSDLIIAPYLSG